MLTIEDFIYVKSPKEAAELAEKRGFTAIWPDENTITLDIDSEADQTRFDSVFTIAQEQFGIEWVDEWKSKDGGKHILLRIADPITPLQRVAFQACLGSDCKRELLALHLLMNCGVEQPSVLFKPPKESD